jgi:glutathione S-transferase
VRVTAEAIGLTVTPIDADHPIGQFALRDLTPLWNGPVGELDGDTIIGMHALLGALERSAVARGEPPKLRLPHDEESRRLHDNVLAVVLGGLGSLRKAIELWGEGAKDLPFLEEAEERTRRALEWLEGRLKPRRRPRAFHASGTLGIPEIALFCALDWMRMAEAYPIHIHGVLQRFVEAWERHALFVSTAPPVEPTPA